MNTRSLNVLWAGLALAAAAGAQVANLPPERFANGVPYVTGGVSEDEANALKRISGAYPLTIELYHNTGGHNQYTANAQVRVTDQSGRVVLDAMADGPFMLVRVPPGQYHVQASLGGQSVESKTVVVGPGGAAKATLAFD